MRYRGCQGGDWFGKAIVDQAGCVLDEIVQAQPGSKVAKRSLVRRLKKQSVTSKRIMTDRLDSFAAATRVVMPGVEHRSHKGLKSCGEFSRTIARARAYNSRISVRWQLTTLRSDLFGAQKFIYRTASRTLHSGQTLLSTPRYGAPENSDRRQYLISHIHARFDQLGNNAILPIEKIFRTSQGRSPNSTDAT